MYCRRLAALCIAHDISISLFYVPTEWNPADRPSRPRRTWVAPLWLFVPFALGKRDIHLVPIAYLITRSNAHGGATPRTRPIVQALMKTRNKGARIHRHADTVLACHAYIQNAPESLETRRFYYLVAQIHRRITVLEGFFQRNPLISATLNRRRANFSRRLCRASSAICAPGHALFQTWIQSSPITSMKPTYSNQPQVAVNKCAI